MKRIMTVAALTVGLFTTTSAFAGGMSAPCTDGSQCQDTMACIEGNCLDDGKLLITLSWAADADLDIFLKTPSGTEISPALSGNIKAEGGELVRDECYHQEQCQADSGHLNVEHIVWDWGPMPEGQFEVWALNFDGRAGADYTITIAKPDGAVETLTGGVEAEAGAESEHHRFTVEDTICETDTDKDGICDKWELEGIDIDEDGVVDYDLPAMGVDPNHKDMFIEVDHLKGQTVFGLGGVTTAFASAPVDNPDGKPGIKMHIEMGEAIDTFAGINVGPTTAFDRKDMAKVKYGTASETDDSNSCAAGWFGKASERESPNCPSIMKARKQIYRYALYVYRYKLFPNSSGIAELGGNDFIVSLGHFRVNTQAKQQGTFMHELGHTMVLGHGGADHINCKPNHLSVMNYFYQMPNTYSGRPLAFGMKLPNLDERKLEEAVGIQGPTSWAQVVFTGPNGLRIATLTDAAAPVDWNQDGDVEDTVGAVVSCPRPWIPTTHGAIDEWKAARIDFRTMAGWNAVFPDTLDLGADEAQEPEMTEEQVDQGAKTSDSDSDGLSNFDDNCGTVPNPEQRDADGDDVGDLCDACPDVPARGYIDGCPEGQSPESTDTETSSDPPEDSPGTPDDDEEEREETVFIDVDKGCSTSGRTPGAGGLLFLIGLLGLRRRRSA